jgi:hypothetical protein
MARSKWQPRGTPNGGAIAQRRAASWLAHGKVVFKKTQDEKKAASAAKVSRVLASVGWCGSSLSFPSPTHLAPPSHRTTPSVILPPFPSPHILASFSVVWCGVVWCGVVWCGVVWFILQLLPPLPLLSLPLPRSEGQCYVCRLSTRLSQEARLPATIKPNHMASYVCV